MGPIRIASRPARLAGEELRERRHVSVLVDGPDEVYASLMPFSSKASTRATARCTSSIREAPRRPSRTTA